MSFVNATCRDVSLHRYLIGKDSLLRVLFVALTHVLSHACFQVIKVVLLKGRPCSYIENLIGVVLVTVSVALRR